MGEAGVFAPEARLELIEGEIVETAPLGSLHAAVVRILNGLFVRLVDDLAIVSGQSPLVVGERSVPEPDIVLLKPRADHYSKSHPVAADALLVIEVSDTTFRFDLDTKIPLYARAGITEAWVVDLQGRTLRVFRDPGAGGYRTNFTVSGDENVSARALPEVRVAMTEIFPK